MKLKNNRQSYAVDPQESLENRWKMFENLVSEKSIENITSIEFEIYVPELVLEIKGLNLKELLKIVQPDTLETKKSSKHRRSKELAKR